jgi:hydrogenase maturation protease
MRSLVIGYGNPSRRDDGVALHVLNELHRRWGRPGLGLLGDGWEDLGGARDTLFLQQLTLELAATVAGYDLLILVDASLTHAQEPVRVEPVTPRYHLAAISHHLDPASLLALARQLYGRAPEALLVSVQGHDFDFGEELSAPAAAAVPEAVERVASLVAAREEAERASPG